MPVPNLIHPVPITVVPLQRGGMVMDDEAREPVHGTRAGTAFTIDAQIRWRDAFMPIPTAGGIREEFDGYFIVRATDLAAIDKTIARGDQVTRMGNMLNLSVFVTDSEPMGHYPDQGGHTLMRYYFSSRRPGFQE